MTGSAVRRRAARLCPSVAAWRIAARLLVAASMPIAGFAAAAGEGAASADSFAAPPAASGCAAPRPDRAGAPAAAPLASADRELRLRWGVRTFAAEFADRVEAAADRIAAATDDASVREAALRWKLGASTAAIRAGLRPPAQLALVDTWTLARQSVRLFDGGPAGEAFGAQQQAALETARALAQEAERLACALLDPAAFEAYRGLVASHAERRPIADLSFGRASIAMAWLGVGFEVGGVPTGVGSLAESGADAIDRVAELVRRAPDWVRWRGELSVTEQSRRLGVVGRGLRALVADPAGEPRALLGRLREEAGLLLGDADRRWSRAKDALRGDRHSLLEALLASPLVRDVLETIALVLLALLGVGAALGWAAARALERRRARRAGVPR